MVNTDGIEEHGTALFAALTGPDQPPMSRGQRDALHHGLVMLTIAVVALVRIADALEAHKPTRPVHDGFDAV